MKLFLIYYFLLIFFISSCNDNPAESEKIDPTTGTVMDIDGNVYQTIKIGNQWWMAENLKAIRYRNGEALPNVTGNSNWDNLSTGAYCNYDNNITYVETYGRLYNGYAVNDSRNIAPVGWHIPSDAEWQILVDFLGGTSVAGGKLKEADTTHWNSPNTDATNESGFSALPGGWRVHSGGFTNIGLVASFWSSKEDNSNSLWSLHLYNFQSDVGHMDFIKRNGFSVRCIKD